MATSRLAQIAAAIAFAMGAQANPATAQMATGERGRPKAPVFAERTQWDPHKRLKSVTVSKIGFPENVKKTGENRQKPRPKAGIAANSARNGMRGDEVGHPEARCRASGQAVTKVSQDFAAGCVAIQCRAISSRRQIQTPECRRT